MKKVKYATREEALKHISTTNTKVAAAQAKMINNMYDFGLGEYKIMSKIFYGGTVYGVSKADEAYEVMDKIARAASGTFEGCSCSETGFYVDADDTVNLGEGRKLYRIKGTADDKSYAETNDKDLFKD